jgi:LacI family transcriptional regulator
LGKTTIKDVARESGVDVSTVSRCLNGGGRIGPKTRDRILAVAARLQYRPNRVARGLVTGRSHSLGLIVSDIRNPFFAELARGAEDAAYAAGYDLILCNSDLRHEKQLGYLSSLVEKAVEGIVINYAAAVDRKQERHLASLGVPVVLLNRPEGLNKVSSISVDNYHGGFLAGRYLAGLGHRRFALLAGPEDQSNHALRASGFRDGIAGADATILHSDQTLAGGYQNAWKLLSARPDTTAIFASNDVMAFGAMRALNEAGKQIPRDISLVGFDNLQLSALTQPPLTTIDQPKYEIGKAAVELCLDLACAEMHVAPVHRVFGVELVERKSAAPPASRAEARR